MNSGKLCNKKTFKQSQKIYKKPYIIKIKLILDVRSISINIYTGYKIKLSYFFFSFSCFILKGSEPMGKFVFPFIVKTTRVKKK